MSDNIVELKNITKTYDKGTDYEVSALTDVNLTIRRGEMLAIMGVSGSGKSTLLHILGALDSPTSGEYFFDGADITHVHSDGLARLRNREIGFVLQDYGLLPGETVFYNVKLPLVFNVNVKRKEMAAKVNDALEKTGLGGFGKRKASKLSGGQKQRVGISRAIVNHPSLLLADEPTGALDSKTAGEIIDVFKQLSAEGITVVMVTHDAKMAERFDRTVYIADGRISDTPEA